MQAMQYREVVMALPFPNRRQAGKALARLLPDLRDRGDVLVLGLPRGGVPVAYEVALVLRAPLDVEVVRKLGVPGREELAMGAIATGGVRVLYDTVVQEGRIDEATIEAVTVRERQELARRERLYRGNAPPPLVRNRTVVLIDDGLATGSTMRAAIAAVRQQQPAAVVVAVPVGDAGSCASLAGVADRVVCAEMPEQFSALGYWYEDFRATPDEEVRELLGAARARGGRS
jgi:predicted phosphoribosyltransferase